jgi:hypothetical protein
MAVSIHHCLQFLQQDHDSDYLSPYSTKFDAKPDVPLSLLNFIGETLHIPQRFPVLIDVPDVIHLTVSPEIAPIPITTTATLPKTLVPVANLVDKLIETPSVATELTLHLETSSEVNIIPVQDSITFLPSLSQSFTRLCLA